MDCTSFRVVQDKTLKEILQRNQTRLLDRNRFVLNQNSDGMKYAPPPKKKQPDATMHLLQTLEQFPCLWDITNEQYCNKNIRRIAYQQMARQLNINGDNIESKVRGKINAVKQIYASELVKINRSKRFTHNVYTPSLSWFDLAHKILGQSMEKNLTQTSLPPTLDDSMSENSSIANSLLKELERKSQLSTDDTEERPTKRKRFSLHSDIDDTLSTVSKPLHFDDEFEIFGRNVACHLRKLSEELALESQSFIQSYLIEQRLKNKKRSSLPTENGMEMSNAPACSSSTFVAHKPTNTSITQSEPQPMDMLVEPVENIPETKEEKANECKIDSVSVPESSLKLEKDKNVSEVNVEKLKSELVRELVTGIAKEIDAEPYISMKLNVSDNSVKIEESKCGSNNESDSSKNFTSSNEIVVEKNLNSNIEIFDVEQNELKKTDINESELQKPPEIMATQPSGNDNIEVNVNSYSEPSIEDNLNEFITIRRKPNQVIEENAENSEEEEEEDDETEESEEEEMDDEIIETVYGVNESDGEITEGEEEPEVLNIDTESDASPNTSPEKNYVEMKPSGYSSEHDPCNVAFSTMNNGSSKYDSTQGYENVNKMYIDSVPVELSKMISVDATDPGLPEQN